MSNKTETGHAVNVANFSELISFVKGYGTVYNPSNEKIALPALKTLVTRAGNSIEAVYVAQAPYNTGVAAREVIYSPLSKLVTRVMNLLKVSGVSQQVYDSVNTVARKIKGGRASAKTTPINGETETATKQVSASQMSYDSREENFMKFIQLLTGIPEYAPNEEDLKLTSLTDLSNEMKAKNSAVIAAEVPLSNARIARNEVLYTPTSGLCDVALSVKNYVKAIYGATSPQYKQIRKLAFSKQKL